MSLNELRNRVKPPDKPFYPGTPELWPQVEIKTALPDDYKAFINLYGGGTFCDVINIYSPFYPHIEDYVNSFEGIIGMYRVLVEGGRLDARLYPEPDGLLPCGKSENGGGYLMWQTTGRPNDWPVVFANIDQLIVKAFHTNFTGFFVKMLRGEIPAYDINITEYTCDHRFTPFR